MPRDVTDEEGTVWNCVQAYAGLNGDAGEKAEAAVAGGGDLVRVVATPSGGAQTIRLELKNDWETSASDEEILDKIKEKR